MVDKIYVHDIWDQKILHKAETCQNPNGLFDISPYYVAYPGSNVAGEVHIFDMVSLVSLSVYIVSISICV